MNRYNRSLFSALSETFPEHEWLPWRFQNVFHGIWREKETCGKFLRWLENKEQFQGIHDWKRHLTKKLLIANGGSGLFHYYPDLESVLNILYPGEEFQVENDVLEFFAKENKLNEINDWFQFCEVDISKQIGGKHIIDKYGSLLSALQSKYPNHNWLPWKWKPIPSKFWEAKENQTNFFNYLFHQLNFKSMEDWYEISSEQIRKFGGHGVLNYYQNSPSLAVQNIFPEHEWITWRFKNPPKDFWNFHRNQKNFFEWVRIKFQVENLEQVTTEMICESGGSKFLRLYYGGSVLKALKTLYPQVEWKNAKSSS